MRIVFLTALLLGGLRLDAQAQDVKQVMDLKLLNLKFFDEAAVVLTTGAILTGTLQLYAEKDVLSLRGVNDSIYTLPAQQVRGFAVKDDIAQQHAGDSYVALQRIFLTFPLPPSRKAVAPAWGFFEQLSRGAGPVLLLRRERLTGIDLHIMHTSSGVTSASLPRPLATAKSYVTTSLYLGTATGPVVFLRKPQDVLKYFAKQAPQLRAYARENGLRYDNNRDLSFLINYANTLVKKP
ncbi:hypothetical protein [Hymenobacter terrestris]|uniref:DUF4369 domain-containing protein n=1 Tax=Hymenobacter terrestris TaxID=2748310 RepID=A0ABX2Q6V6_9BACT|nr:hypothetical protein [Hymenobacter terrestris]NVO86710.1 hypothetical protein [Hymenobacter terrestris]